MAPVPYPSHGEKIHRSVSSACGAQLAARSINLPLHCPRMAGYVFDAMLSPAGLKPSARLKTRDSNNRIHRRGWRRQALILLLMRQCLVAAP